MVAFLLRMHFLFNLSSKQSDSHAIFRFEPLIRILKSRKTFIISSVLAWLFTGILYLIFVLELVYQTCLNYLEIARFSKVSGMCCNKITFFFFLAIFIQIFRIIRERFRIVKISNFTLVARVCAFIETERLNVLDNFVK